MISYLLYYPKFGNYEPIIDLASIMKGERYGDIFLAKRSVKL